MKRYLFIIMVIFFAVSCENEIPFKISENPPKLVVNALFESGKPVNEIVLALTGRDKVTFVEDASIDIFVNGEVKDHLAAASKKTHPDGSRDIVYTTGVHFTPNDIVRIEVRTNDEKHVASSVAVVPQPVNIERVDISLVSKDSGLGTTDEYLRARTTFADDGKQVNYYRIGMFFDLEIETKNPISLNDTIICQTVTEILAVNEDVVLTDGRPTTDNDDMGLLLPVRNRYGVFDNSRIDGTYTMTTSIRIPYYAFGYIEGHKPEWYEHIERIRVKARIKLLSISQMQYLYLKALNIHESTDDGDFFSLPVKFPSNIEGGTGIFGLGVGSEAVIPLEDYIPATTDNLQSDFAPF